jgi:hypothetical protein
VRGQNGGAATHTQEDRDEEALRARRGRQRWWRRQRSSNLGLHCTVTRPRTATIAVHLTKKKMGSCTASVYPEGDRASHADSGRGGAGKGGLQQQACGGAGLGLLQHAHKPRAVVAVRIPDGMKVAARGL